MNSFTFNGSRRDYVTILRGREIPLWTSINREMSSVSGMVGSYHTGDDISPKRLKIPIVVESRNLEQLEEMKEDLADWLVTDEVKELIFDNQPNRTYYAMLEDLTVIESLIRVGTGTLNFICPDPYKYGDPIDNRILDSSTLQVEGTAKTKPIFTLEVLEPVTFAMISTGEKYNLIGEIPTIDEVPFEKEELIDRFTMGATTGWTEATEIEGGAVAGHIVSDGDTFRPNSYGNGSNWHGPAMKTSLSEQLQNFKMDVFCSLKATTGQQVGRLEIYLYGAGNEIIGKLAMKDIRKGRNVATGEARVGDYQDGHYLINTPGVREGLWNDFYGILRLSRVDNVITAYVSRIDKGVYNTAWSATFEDTQGLFQEPITQVGVHFGQNGTSPFIADIGVHEIRMFKINQEPEGIPIIADVGDIITLDHVDENLLINGESRIDLKDFGAEYFKLSAGFNSLAVLPEGSFNTSVKYRPTYR